VILVVKDPSQHIVWMDNSKVVGRAAGMKATLKNAEKVMLETERTEKHWRNLTKRRILLSFMKSG
jgi:hypothetical protein